MIEQPDFTGRYALIAGCCDDLTEAVARSFARAGGAGLVLSGLALERGQTLAAIMSAAGCDAHMVPADLTRAEDCTAILAKAEQAFGRLDLLIFTGVAADDEPVLAASPEVIDHTMAGGVRAALLLMQGAAALMCRMRIPGALLTVLGSAGGTPSIGAACEGALATMTESFAAALAGNQIRVLALIMPHGSVRPDPGEIARALLRLAADASQLTSGAIVPMETLTASAAA